MITINKLVFVFALIAAAAVGGIGTKVVIGSSSNNTPQCAPAKGIDSLPPGEVKGTGAHKGY